MAFVPEFIDPSYPSGVYQLDAEDRAAGGADGILNTPLKDLANRTKYLKSKVDGIIDGTIATTSTLKETPAISACSHEAVDAAFVARAKNNLLMLTFTSGCTKTLTVSESLCTWIYITGTLTGNVVITLDQTAMNNAGWDIARQYDIVNHATMGTYTITFQDTLLPSGRSNILTGQAGGSWAMNSTSLGGYPASDYALLSSPTFTNNPTAVTQLKQDHSTRLATTQYVQDNTHSTATYSLTGGDHTLTLAESLANTIILTGAAPYSTTITIDATVLSGDGAASVGRVYNIINNNSGAHSVSFNTNSVTGTLHTLNAGNNILYYDGTDNLYGLVTGQAKNVWGNLYPVSRTNGVNYTNSFTTNWYVYVTFNCSSFTNNSATLYVNSKPVAHYEMPSNAGITLCAVVPPGGYYSVAIVGTTITYWSEII